MSKARDAGADPNLSLLDFTNTPTVGVGCSPAQSLLVKELKFCCQHLQGCLFLRVSRMVHTSWKKGRPNRSTTTTRVLENWTDWNLEMLCMWNWDWTQRSGQKLLSVRRSISDYIRSIQRMALPSGGIRQTREPFSKKKFEFPTEYHRTPNQAFSAP